MTITEDNTGSADGEFGDELKPGTQLLHGQYTIERFLNSGGFGMTYLAKDSLDRIVVIKECYPASFCCRTATDVRARSRSQQTEFNAIVRLFGQEARRLSKLDHPNIVGVHQVFEDNGTAYMALDYVHGKDLLDIIEEEPNKFGPTEIRAMLMKLLEAIAFIHDQSILHRDISPDNILIDDKDNPVLIDFGAAREKATKASRALSALLVVKDGYSPQEFYVAGSKQNPSSDLYALAASFYHLIVGEAPPNSQIRLAAVAAKDPDPYIPIVSRVFGYDGDFLRAIDQALSVFPKHRLQSARDWMVCIDADARKKVLLENAQDDATTDLAISKLVSEALHAVEAEARAPKPEPKPKVKTPSYQLPERKPSVVVNLDDEFDDEPEDASAEASGSVPVDVYVSKKPRVKYFDAPATEKRPKRRFWFFGRSRSGSYGKARP